jgi:hypothetical protein
MRAGRAGIGLGEAAEYVRELNSTKAIGLDTP